MAGLKELRTRISAVKSTEKITSAMKMVAASRLRKAQTALLPSKEYMNALLVSAKRVLEDIKQEEIEKKIYHILPAMMRTKKTIKKYLLVVFSSDKGLCGSYNSNINRTMIEQIKTLESKKAEVKVFCVGKKAYTFLKKIRPELLVGYIEDIAKKGPDYVESSQLAKKISEMYCADFDECRAIYTEFKTALSREIKTERLLPVEISVAYEDVKGMNNIKGKYYTYEPDRIQLLENLLPLVFEAKFFDIIVHSQASEYGARMSSMDNATRNAKDMIAELTLKYNTIRQSEITTELIEIIAGAEAL